MLKTSYQLMIHPSLPNSLAAAPLVAVLAAEYITASESGQVGRTVYFSDVGNKQLEADFSPLVNLDGTSDVSWYVDQKDPLPISLLL